MMWVFFFNFVLGSFCITLKYFFKLFIKLSISSLPFQMTAKLESYQPE